METNRRALPDLLPSAAAALGGALAYLLGRGGAGLWALPVLCAAAAAAVLFFLRRRRALERRLVDRSRRDSLTELYNRRAAEALIDQTLRGTEPGRCHAFLLFDIDNFKTLNDSCGHIFGDVVLSEFAALLVSQSRSADILGRSGGDEFIVLMMDCGGPALTEEKLQRFCAKLSHKRFGDRDLSVSVSVGVAYCPDHGTCYAELFEQADQALYYAKAHGKGTYCTAGAERSQESYVSQRDLNRLMEAASDGIVKLACDGDRLVPLWFSASFLALTGMAASRLSDPECDFFSLIPEVDQGPLRSAISEAAPGRRPFRTAVHLRRPEGETAVCLRAVFLSETWNGDDPVIFAAVTLA